MKLFEIQAVGINSTFEKTFQYVADIRNLPEWTHAFKRVSNGRAFLETPNGVVEIALEANASKEHGTIDWTMRFPDGSLSTAYSRVVKAAKNRCVYSFILMAPPVSLEQVEGTLRQQSEALEKELARLTSILSEELH